MRITMSITSHNFVTLENSTAYVKQQMDDIQNAEQAYVGVKIVKFCWIQVKLSRRRMQ